MTAFYCFDNLGWPPGKYNALPEREKALVRAFAQHVMKKREEELRQQTEVR